MRMGSRTIPVGNYIISAFPGTGKTSAAEQCSTKRYPVLDLESSTWSHDSDGNLKDDFPKRYVDEAISRLNDNNFVLVSSHEQVRRELEDRGVKFIYVIPGRKDIIQYIDRYNRRGSSEKFIANIKRNWHEWMSPEAYKGTDVVMTLLPYQYVSDIIQQIKHNSSLRKSLAEHGL